MYLATSSSLQIQTYSLQIQTSSPANSNMMIFEFAEMTMLPNTLAMLEFATMLRGGGRSVKMEFTNTSDYL